jgi:DNA-binding NarL/FixJ family response regulator
MTIRVALVDDHKLVRAGIAGLLREIPDVEVVGEGSDGASAIRLADEHADLDVLFLDLAMPDMSGLDALERIKKGHPEQKVIVLSMYSNEEYVLRAMRLGAQGFILKDVDPDELSQALKAVVNGDTCWLSSAISKKVIDGYVGRTSSQASTELLSSRQLQVLKLIAEGASTKQISSQLELSVKTIETYRLHIMERLDIHDLAGLVRYAIREGIVAL